MDRSWHRLACALLIILVCEMGVHPQSPADDKAADSNTRGKITGHVVNESGQPMPNAAVTVRGYGSSEVRSTVATDGEGNFEVTDLPPNAYLVSARALAYVARPRDPDVNPVGYYRIGDSVRLEMMKGGVITGAVKRPNGEPVVSVSVRAYLVRDYKGQRPPYSTPSIDVKTDDRGIYRIYGLAPGTYIVATVGGGPWGYEVDPFVSDVPTYAPSSTRDTATEFTIVAGDETANVDIRYRDEPGHLVSGKVTGADQQSGYDVRLNFVSTGIEQAAYETYQPMARGFIFSGVADGDYDIVATNYSAGGWSVTESRRIKVQGGDITNVELNVKPLASINGIVAMEDSRATECQGKRRPLFGEIVVGAYHNERNTPKEQPQFLWGMGGPVTPDAQGAFTLRNLAAGQYRFVTRPMAKYWYLKSITWPAAARAAQTNQPPDAARNWTTIRSGDKYSALTITFAAGAASIAGRVEPPSGQRLASRMFVYLTPAESEKREDVLRYFASVAAEDGAFALTNIPPGRYWILAKAAAENETNVVAKLRTPDESELRARILHDAETEKFETELKPCQNVTDYHLAFRPR